MRILRWFLGFLLFILAFVALENRKATNSVEVVAPKYERTTLKGRDFVYYTVQPGDTLSMLERKFRIPARESILALNPGLNPDDLPVSKQIKIPLD